ncbi:hypothetical protein EVA_06663 [gut metagenome]|uniref:Uncharacterized protein n=1 Tax=gut metagenome TaxID=749906 RepID=J9GRN0_9ZZZZ
MYKFLHIVFLLFNGKERTIIAQFPATKLNIFKHKSPL